MHAASASEALRPRAAHPCAKAAREAVGVEAAGVVAAR